MESKLTRLVDGIIGLSGQSIHDVEAITSLRKQLGNIPIVEVRETDEELGDLIPPLRARAAELGAGPMAEILRETAMFLHRLVAMSGYP